MAGGAALLRQAQVAAAQAANANPQTPEERRRQLEAELASLERPRVDSFDSRESVRVEGYDVSPTGSSTSSSPGLRERTNSSSGRVGAFEEVEVPSDVEDPGVGQPVEKPTSPTRRTSWFGWGAAAGGSKGAYEKVKSD